MLAPHEWQRLRAMYVDVGTDWHWRDRLGWTEDAWREHAASPRVRVHALVIDQRDAGYVELARHDDGLELAYFGLSAFAHGRKLGRWLLERAIAEAQAWGQGPLRVHTCTLDGPAALPNYLARGFRVTRTETYEANVEGA